MHAFTGIATVAQKVFMGRNRSLCQENRVYFANPFNDSISNQ